MKARCSGVVLNDGEPLTHLAQMDLEGSLGQVRSSTPYRAS
jgi:hypothetical protein